MDMEIELLIKRITEEVYGKIRAEQESGGTSATDTHGAEWLLCRMNPGMRIGEVKAACDEAKACKVLALCIPQWFVDYAVAELSGTGIKVATVVGLPGGATSTFAKYAEVKQAVVSGAQTILIPVSMQLCASGDWGAIKNDLAEAMVPCKGKAEVFAVLETGVLSSGQLEAAADVCSACGVDAVLLSAVTGGNPTAAQVAAIKNKGIRVGVMGGVNVSSFAAFRQAGVSLMAASKLP